MSYLTTHAIKHVWADARTDYYNSFMTAFISGVEGLRGFVPEPWGNKPLPNGTDDFVVITLGRLPLNYVGFPSFIGGWKLLSKLATEDGVEVCLNSQSGGRIPTGECWITNGKDNSMIIAIRRSPVVDYIIGRNRIRWTSYRNPGADRSTKYYTNSVVMDSREAGMNIYNEWVEAKEVGDCQLYHNGWLVDFLTPADMDATHSLHYECRTYVANKELIPLNDIESFNSELDSVRKYLIHLPKLDGSMHYRNDVDIKLVHVNDDGHFHGIDVQPNKASDYRMVTHSDISISNDLIQGFVNAVNENFKPTHMQVVLKDSQLGRKPWYDRYFVTELYTLDDIQIYNNLIGYDSVITEWQAAGLEQSDYNRIMEAEDGMMTDELIISGYGYNGVVEACEKSPIVLDNTVVNFEAPFSLRTNSSYICYDKDGYQIAIESGQANIITVSEETVTVDGLFGDIEGGLDITYNKQASELDPKLAYVFWRQQTSGDGGAWELATEGSDYYIANDMVTWTLSLTGWNVAVISNGICPLIPFQFEDNKNTVMLNDLLKDLTKLDIDFSMFGSYELYQGNERLIMDIDYTISDKGMLVLHSKDKCSQADDAELKNENFTLIVYGLSDEGVWELGDSGFITNSTVSQNHRYNIVNGFNGVFICDGKVYAKEQVLVDEDGVPGTVNLPNGRPYQFFTRRATCMGINWDRKALLEERDALAKKIENYFTLIKGKVTYPVTPIDRYYYLVSCTLNAMIIDILNRDLNIPYGRITDDELIADYLPTYQDQIDNDVCQKDFGKDSIFVEIHPTPYYHYLTLTKSELDFLTRVNNMVLGSKVKLSRYLSIGRN